MKLFFFFTETGSLTPQLTTFNPKENCTLLLMGWPLKMHHLPLNWVHRKSKIHTLTCGQGFGRRGERSHQVQKWRFSCSCVESDPTTEPQKQVEMDCRERKERWRKEGEKCFREDASAWKSATQWEYRTSVSTGVVCSLCEEEGTAGRQIYSSFSLWTHPVFTQHLARIWRLAGEVEQPAPISRLDNIDFQHKELKQKQVLEILTYVLLTTSSFCPFFNPSFSL